MLAPRLNDDVGHPNLGTREQDEGRAGGDQADGELPFIGEVVEHRIERTEKKRMIHIHTDTF